MGDFQKNEDFSFSENNLNIKHSARITDSKSSQTIESVLKYKNGFKNNLMYKEIFN
jgi:hypothetical protein